VLLTAFFVAVNAFGFAHLKRTHSALRQEEQRLRTRALEAETWLGQAALWDERAAWIEANQPALDEVEQANPRLLNAMKDAAQRHDVDVTNETFLDPVSDPHFYAARVRLTCAGSLEALARWFVAIQQPEQFQAVGAFTLKSDKDPARLICTVEMSRLYRPLRSTGP